MELRNIYHCTIHKAASQWVRMLFDDPRISSLTRMKTYGYESQLPGGVDIRPVAQRDFSKPFPPGLVVSPLYIHYQHFQSMPKPGNYKCFFVMRDPRDLVVSNYFSRKYSHPQNPRIKNLQEKLHDNNDLQEGLQIIIDWLEYDGIFDVLRSWKIHAPHDPHVMIIAYETLTSPVNGLETLQQLLHHLQVPLSRDQVQKILDDYSFERITGGRKPGEENIYKHHRKGIAGDWKNHFSPTLIQSFNNQYHDLLELLGYDI